MIKDLTPEELELHYRDCMLWVYDVVVGACRDSEVEIDIECVKAAEWTRWLSFVERGINPWNPFDMEDCDNRPELN